MAPLRSNGTAAVDAPPASAVLSSAFLHLPFAFQGFFPLKPCILGGAASAHHAGFCSDLLSGADRCFKELSTAVSEHPSVKLFLSFQSGFQNLCQMQCRSFRVKCLPSSHCFAAILPGDSMAGLVVANGLTNFLNIYNTLLIVRLVLTWFPNSPPAIVSPLSTICDPYLNIFRGIIPPLGGTLDLSPILAFFVLNAFMSTASALPAELPQTSASDNRPNQQGFSNLKTSQEKWTRRIFRKRSMDAEDSK